MEIDEGQYKSYDCECEQARMVNVTQDFRDIPVVWVRFIHILIKISMEKGIDWIWQGYLSTLQLFTNVGIFTRS